MSNEPNEVSPSWPNQKEVVDGVTPTSEISQDPNLFKGDDLDAEMES